MSKKKPMKRQEIIAQMKAYLDKANSLAKKDIILANKYVQKARRLNMRYKVPIPRDLKRRFCRHCFTILIPGCNLRIRTREGHVVYYCLTCKKYMRYVYSKKN